MSSQFSIHPSTSVHFEVIYECEDFIVINKPPGLTTQPHDFQAHNTLLNGLFSRWGKQLQNLGKKRDFGLLHRLDRGTSGLLIVALTPTVYDALRSQFEERSIQKEYWAIIDGIPSPTQGRCQFWIREERHGSSKRAKVLVSPKASFQGAQPACTLYKVITHAQTTDLSTKYVSLIACRIETGRLHQIRAHMSTLGHPIMGDFDYGGANELNRLARKIERGTLGLHAIKLNIYNPCTQKRCSFIAPPSLGFRRFTQRLGLSLKPVSS